MVDDHGVRTALRLATLTGIVDDKRIDQRHVAKQQIGKTLSGKADALARQPFERAMFSDVNDRVSIPSTFGSGSAQPSIERGVMMRWR